MINVPDALRTESHLNLFTDALVDRVAIAMSGGGIIGAELRLTLAGIQDRLASIIKTEAADPNGLILEDTVRNLGAITGLLGIEHRENPQTIPDRSAGSV